ncbi:hypothetical protein LZQ00_08475 [Sphingobacterium sp. SRCM116780]|uniref:hypothetical protein n=1 Tax=Sphingobacterium sp. SRCM116780 TaxID=2907623 RepID=UPI001F39F59C|nr:hypothetical protein [Sphingobacterium sp. SRCM116780]UIR57843.1 hypothetical protein LZQ00_08475 [Sphingobacterium sp. SRCM116780]
MNTDVNEERILPTIEIAGAYFYVDSLHDILIDTADKNNTIHVLEMMVLEDHYEMLFDKVNRNLKEYNWLERDDNRYEYIWLHPLEIYDPEGAKIALERSNVNLERFPVIDIAGIPFLWNQQRSCLMLCENPFNRIHKCSYTTSDNGTWGIYIDTDKKVLPFPYELEALKSKNGNLPAHIKFVDISQINNQINAMKNKQAIPLKRKKPRLS